MQLDGNMQLVASRAHLLLHFALKNWQGSDNDYSSTYASHLAVCYLAQYAPLPCTIWTISDASNMVQLVQGSRRTDQAA